MGLEPYSVTLEKEVVEKAKKKVKSFGGKLSPILNRLLVAWVQDSEAMDKIINKLEDNS